MILESPACVELRYFLNSPEIKRFPREVMLQRLAEKTGLTEEVLDEPEELLKVWKPEWGELSLDEYQASREVFWKRPDRGPTMIQPGSMRSLNDRLLEYILKSLLIQELAICGLTSYISTTNPEASRYSVYLDYKPILQVIWACAILGCCETLEDPTKPPKRSWGKVTIKRMNNTQSFF